MTLSTRTEHTGLAVEAAVYNRYAAAAARVEPALCCPTTYPDEYLRAIPDEVLERDYGCGDPTAFANPGDVVLDLGAGAGKLCFILSQVVGPDGRVIGVDCNQEMLRVARRNAPRVGERLGYANVEFKYGLIQDLQLDLDRLAVELTCRPVVSPADWLALRAMEDRLRVERPMIADESVDCVVSNCVLNLVRPGDRRQLFAEIHRVLKRGGRAAISDIVADEDVPESLQRDPQLWSGCLSGAYREDRFLRAFEEAGFHGIQLARRATNPWQTIEGIEFRSVTVLAYKGKAGPCLERNQAVQYKGPFRKVEDDDGHVFVRGERIAVCDKTFHLLQQAPYTGCFAAIEPREPVPLDDARPFDCRRSVRRDPRETKGADFRETTDSPNRCGGPNWACC